MKNEQNVHTHVHEKSLITLYAYDVYASMTFMNKKNPCLGKYPGTSDAIFIYQNILIFWGFFSPNMMMIRIW